MYETSVTVKIECADCGAVSVNQGIVSTDVPDMFDAGHGEALLQVECPQCHKFNLRFVNKADLEALENVGDN